MSINYIINPKTNRPIKLGNRTHRRILADSIRKVDTRGNNVVFDSSKDDEPNVENFNKNDQYITPFNDKIITRYRHITNEQLLQHILTKVPDIIDSFLGAIDESMNPLDQKAKLNQLFYNKLFE